MGWIYFLFQRWGIEKKLKISNISSQALPIKENDRSLSKRKWKKKYKKGDGPFLKYFVSLPLRFVIKITEIDIVKNAWWCQLRLKPSTSRSEVRTQQLRQSISLKNQVVTCIGPKKKKISKTDFICFFSKQR